MGSTIQDRSGGFFTKWVVDPWNHQSKIAVDIGRFWDMKKIPEYGVSAGKWWWGKIRQDLIEWLTWLWRMEIYQLGFWDTLMITFIDTLFIFFSQTNLTILVCYGFGIILVLVQAIALVHWHNHHHVSEPPVEYVLHHCLIRPLI